MSLIYFILSNAAANLVEIAILYSRTSLSSFFFSMLLAYFTTNIFFSDTITLFNGLVYCNLTTLLFSIFMYLLVFLILSLTSFYPKETAKGIKSDDRLISWDSRVEDRYQLDSVHGVNKNSKNIDSVEKSESKSFKIFTSKDFIQKDREHYKLIEYSLLFQFILIGGTTLLSSNDLITIFLAIELQSYGLYIISSIYRNSESSTNAGLTYFLLGGLSSCIILLGQNFLYINLGITNLDSLYIVHNIFTSSFNLFSYFTDLTCYYQLLDSINIINNFYADIGINNNNEVNHSIITYSSLFVLDYQQYSMQFALVIFSIGFLFKISASPFHSWSPSVYDGIPTVTTTFVAILAKVSIFILFFDLVYSTWNTTINLSWINILLYSSFLSLIIGSVLGLTQTRIKRLYAYSTISHVGFILLALCIHSVESIKAFFFYIIQYSLSNLNAFLIIIVIGYLSVNYISIYENNKNFYNESLAYKNFLKKINTLSPIEYIKDLKGYIHINSILALSLSITFYSFIGVPPLVGFFAKQMILSSALDNGYLFMTLVAISTSVISAVYYLYVIKTMFFDKSELKINKLLSTIENNIFNNDFYNITNGTNQTLKISSWLTCIISLLTLLMTLFVFLYYELFFQLNILSIYIIY